MVDGRFIFHSHEPSAKTFLAKPCMPDLLWWEIHALLNPLV